MKPVDENGHELRLALHIDPEQITVDELAFLIEPSEFRPSVFKTFMARFSNWTAVQVGKLTMAEMTDVIKDIGTALRDMSVPKVPTPPSAPGAA